MTFCPCICDKLSVFCDFLSLYFLCMWSYCHNLHGQIITVMRTDCHDEFVTIRPGSHLNSVEFF